MAYKLRGETEFEKGMGLPRLTTTQRTTYTPPEKGYKVYDITEDAEYTWDGSVWVLVPVDLSNYVTLDSAQTITGSKTFDDAIILEGDDTVTQKLISVTDGTIERGHISLDYSTTNPVMLIEQDQGVHIGTNLSGGDGMYMSSSGIQLGIGVLQVVVNDLQDSVELRARQNSGGSAGLYAGPLNAFFAGSDFTIDQEGLYFENRSGNNDTVGQNTLEIKTVGTNNIFDLVVGKASLISFTKPLTPVGDETITLGAKATSPTTVSGDAGGVLTTKDYVDAEVAGASTDLSNYVTLDGAETITGVKTFASTSELVFESSDATPVVLTTIDQQPQQFRINTTDGLSITTDPGTVDLFGNPTFSVNGTKVEAFGPTHTAGPRIKLSTADNVGSSGQLDIQVQEAKLQAATGKIEITTTETIIQSDNFNILTIDNSNGITHLQTLNGVQLAAGRVNTTTEGRLNISQSGIHMFVEDNSDQIISDINLQSTGSVHTFDVNVNDVTVLEYSDSAGVLNTEVPITAPAFVGGETSTTLTTKGYVDAEIAGVDATTKVDKAGDTMTGELILANSTPVSGLAATTKDYTDTADNLRALKTGDTFTGNIVQEMTEPRINLRASGNLQSRINFFTNYSTTPVWRGQIALDHSQGQLRLLYNDSSGNTGAQLNIEDDRIESTMPIYVPATTVSSASNTAATKGYVDGELAAFVPSNVVTLTGAQTIAGKKTFTSTMAIDTTTAILEMKSAGVDSPQVRIFTNGTIQKSTISYDEPTDRFVFRKEDNTGSGGDASNSMEVYGDYTSFPKDVRVTTMGTDTTSLATKGYVDAEISTATNKTQPQYELVSSTGATSYTLGFTDMPGVIPSGKAVMQVFVNGIKQVQGSTKAYTYALNTSLEVVITFTTGNIPASGDDIEFYGFG